MIARVTTGPVRVGRLAMRLVPGIRRADLVIAVLCAAIVAVATIGSAWSLDARRDALDRRLADLGPAEANVVVRSADLVALPASVDPLDVALATVDDVTTDFPPALVAVLDEPVTVVDTTRFTLDTVNGRPLATPTNVVIRVQPDLDANATIVDGRDPRTDRPDSDAPDSNTVEVVLAVATASELSVGVGDELAVALDLDDPLARRHVALPEPFRIIVSGIVELTPPADPFWFGDARLHRPIVDDTPLGAERIAYVAAPPGVLVDAPFSVADSTPLATEFRTRVDVDRVTLADVDTVRDAVAEVDATTTRTAAIGRASVVVGIGGALDTSNEERTAARDLGRFALVGWSLVALTSIAQLDLGRQHRRRREHRLLERRGTPRGAVLAAVAVTASIPVAVATAVGSAGAVLVSNAVDLPASPLVAVVSAVVVVVTVGTMAAVHASTGGRVERTELPGGLRVARVDATPPMWRRAGPIVRLATVVAWCACLAVVVQTGVRAADATTWVVVYGSGAVAVFATHRSRSVRDARWSAFGASTAAAIAASAAVAGAWTSPGVGRAGAELADRVGWEATWWAASAVALAAIGVAGRGGRELRPVATLAVSSLLNLVLLTIVGRIVVARVDLDGDGRAIDGPLAGSLVAASAAAAILVATSLVVARRPVAASVEPPPKPSPSPSAGAAS